jgi:hypothetical protein
MEITLVSTLNIVTLLLVLGAATRELVSVRSLRAADRRGA